jgi:hypothetical protein
MTVTLRSIIVALLASACATGSVQSTTPRGSRDATTSLDAALDAQVTSDAGALKDATRADAAVTVDQRLIDARPDPDMPVPMDRGSIDMLRVEDAAPDRAQPVDMAMLPPDMAAPAVDMAPPPPDMAIEIPEGLVINEIDYDQPGNDLADFVEILNTAPTPATLDAVQVEFINGDPLETYRVVPLDGVLASGGRLVLGQQAVLDELPGNVRGILIADGIQNGAPDAIRLSTPAGPIDGVAYEGDLPGWGEGAGPIAADQGLDAGGSLARCPDGADTDDNATDVRLVAQPTPGAANACR